MRSERENIKLEKTDFRPLKADFQPERPYVGGEDEQGNERTKVPCILQDFVPFEAAAQGHNFDVRGGGVRIDTALSCLMKR